MMDTLAPTTAGNAPVRADSSQADFQLTPPHSARTQMRVTKRNGEREAVDVNKIVRAVSRCGDGLDAVDPMRVALKTIAGLYDGATTRALMSCRFARPRHSRSKSRSTRASRPGCWPASSTRKCRG